MRMTDLKAGWAKRDVDGAKANFIGLGADYALVEKNALYRCLDKVLAYKSALFDHLTQRWQDLFGARFDILLYDHTA